MAIMSSETLSPAMPGDRTAQAKVIRAGLILALLLACLLSLGWGAVGDAKVIRALLAPLGLAEAAVRDVVIVWDIRMPRMLTSALVGAGLAVAGVVLQGLFRNPLADPGIIGISSGASLGAVMAIVLGGLLPLTMQGWFGIYLVPVAAFVFGWLTTLLLYRVATQNGRTSVATMLLAGIALSALTGAVTGLVVYHATDDQLRDLTFWGLGSVAGATWTKLFAAGPLILISLAVAPFLARALNALALGESAAAHLGIHVQKMKRIAILSVAAGVGASVAVTGGIGFIGIVVPHLLRLVQGPDHKPLMVNAALLGAVTLLLADGIARTIIAPAELPIGIITAVMGGPFFLWILLRNRNLVDL